MKKILLLTTALIITGIANSQNSSNSSKTKQAKPTSTCEISGIVRYLYNERIGYRPDTGSTIYVLKQNDLDTSFDYELFLEYQELAKLKITFLELKQHAGSFNMDNEIREKFGFTIEAEKRFDEVEEKNSSITFNIARTLDKTKSDYRYETFVDASSSYKINIPFGDYYIIIKSKNRNRPFSPELLSRLYIEKVTINKPTYICSFDFDF